jgi:hypothetical protein
MLTAFRDEMEDQNSNAQFGSFSWMFQKYPQERKKSKIRTQTQKSEIRTQKSA